MAISMKAYRDDNGEIVYVKDGSYADSNIGPLTRVPAMDYSISNDELTNESPVPEHTHTASEITDFDTEVSNNASVTANTAKRTYPLADENKLATIEDNAKDDQDSDEVPFDNSGTNLSGSNAAAVIKELDTRTSAVGGLQHSNLGGLGNDDHTQYHNDTRGDARYYTKTLLDGGQLDNRYYTETELNGGALDALYYTQSALDGGALNSIYYTKTLLDGGQLDNRYYTETELNNGALNALYYTETELDGGALNSIYYTKTLLDGGQLDNRYYTETELDSGQLDNRYYTETELNAGVLDSRYYTETELNSGVLNGLYYTQTAADLLLAAKQSISEKNQPNGYAGVGPNGKIPTSIIPALAITEPFVVADIAARDALVIGSGDGEVQKGDISIVVDASADPQVDSGGASYIHDGSVWIRLITPTDLVISVNGLTGAVVLTTSEIGEGTNLYYTEARVSANTSVVANTNHRGIVTGNPHKVTISESIAEDSGTDITVAELETLTDNSDASGLHNHNGQYYTKLLLDAGQLDNRYYTETELNGGQLDNRYYTETELDGGALNALYYTQSALDGGQLDNRYYTETEINNLLSPKVAGPASAVNNKIATYDGTTGKLIKDSGVGIIDEDDMSSNSETDVPTQQSVKAYVDGVHKWVVTQPAHGFTITNNIPIPARLSGATYVAAQADSNNTLSAFYITKIVDVNTFEVKQAGRHDAPSHGLTTGQYYFLSDSVAGGVTSTEPLNSINDVVWYIVDANTILLIDNRPVDNESLQKYLIKVSNTDITTNINQATYTEVPITGTVEVNENNYYTVVGNGIRIDKTRSYTLNVNVHSFSGGQRTALQGRFFVNGNPVGAVASTGYIRNTQGHNEASLHLTEKFSLTDTDVVTFRIQRESTATTSANMPIIGSSNLMIEAR